MGKSNQMDFGVSQSDEIEHVQKLKQNASIMCGLKSLVHDTPPSAHCIFFYSTELLAMCMLGSLIHLNDHCISNHGDKLNTSI